MKSVLTESDIAFIKGLADHDLDSFFDEVTKDFSPADREQIQRQLDVFKSERSRQNNALINALIDE